MANKNFLTLTEELKYCMQNLPELVKEKEEKEVFGDINVLSGKLSDLRTQFSKKEEDSAKERFQRDIVPIGVEATFFNHVVKKPFGYAGDFMAMEMIWDAFTNGSTYSGSTNRGKLINAYSMQMENCKATYNRVHFLLSKIDEVVHEADTTVKITSIGSGPCIEVREYFKRKSANGKAKFFLIDMEKEAISFAKSKINGNGSTVFHEQNIRKLTSENTAKDLIGEQNLIYSSGLYDYFSIKASKRFTKSLWKIVKPGGRLLITNAHPSCPSRLWMEFGGDWYLDYKTEEELFSIAEDLDSVKEIKYYIDDFSVFQYLEVVKS